jgi:glycosyltransferase involved in cell wall biosynthesis
VQWGGLHAFAASLNAGLRSAGWRWTVIIPPDVPEVQQRLRNAGVEVVSAPLLRFRRSPLKNIQTLTGMAENIRSLALLTQVQQATLIQAVGAHHLHGAMLASKLCKPLVWQLHSSILPRPLRQIAAPFIAARAHATMANGHAVARAFWPDASTAKNRFLFYAPVDTERFRPNADARAAARASLRYEEETLVVGTLGNRVWQKNHSMLIDVARRLTPHYPRVRFLILGERHPGFSREYARHVEKPAALLNRQFADYIRFLYPGDRVSHWLQALDIFTLTSHAEGVPIALAEAMSSAKPVVSTRVGSVEEIVEDGITGLLSPRSDAATFARRLSTLIEDAICRRRMGSAARERILTGFTLQSVVSTHLSAYETALAAFEEKSKH